LIWRATIQSIRITLFLQYTEDGIRLLEPLFTTLSKLFAQKRRGFLVPEIADYFTDFVRSCIQFEPINSAPCISFRINYYSYWSGLFTEPRLVIGRQLDDCGLVTLWMMRSETGFWGGSADFSIQFLTAGLNYICFSLKNQTTNQRVLVQIFPFNF
jgi:hypothetical protein